MVVELDMRWSVVFFLTSKPWRAAILRLPEYPNLLSRTLSYLAATCHGSVSLADTLWLKNGDWLSGKIRILKGGKLLLQTDYAGTLTLDWNQLQSVESDQ